MVTCPRCGVEVQPDWDHCLSCGLGAEQVEDAPAPSPPPPAPPYDPAQRYAPAETLPPPGRPTTRNGGLVVGLVVVVVLVIVGAVGAIAVRSGSEPEDVTSTWDAAPSSSTTAYWGSALLVTAAFPVEPELTSERFVGYPAHTWEASTGDAIYVVGSVKVPDLAASDVGDLLDGVRDSIVEDLTAEGASLSASSDTIHDSLEARDLSFVQADQVVTWRVVAFRGGFVVAMVRAFDGAPVDAQAFIDSVVIPTD